MSSTQSEGSTALATVVAPQPGGTITRQGFGTQEMQVLAETAVTASAAAVRAEIEAAFVVAMQRPRNMDLVYERIIRDTKRTAFADRAVFRLKRKQWNPDTREYEQKIIKGLSIRFTESAIRHMGNAMLKAQTLYDDDDKQIVQVVAMDLETNTRFEETVVLSKTVERKTVKDGTPILGKRRNSYGDVVYLVPATDDEFRQKRGAEISRARRNVGNELVPADIREDAIEQCEKTMLVQAKQDPEAERKKLIGGFSDMGVNPEMLVEYLGHELSLCQPAELVELRQLWRAISEGQTTWRAIMEQKVDAEAAKTSAKPVEDAKKKTAAEKLKARVAPAAEKPAEREPGDDTDELGLT